MDTLDYFKLKEKYQNILNLRKDKIKKDASKTIREKRRDIKRLVPKCINCGRPGGTIFEEKNNILKASCGSTPPCNLNLVIKRKRYDNLRELDHANEKIIDNLKMRIIISKLDYLFGFIASKDDAIDKFNVLKNELTTISEEQLIINKKYAEIIGGIHRDPLINETNADLIYQIEQLKEMYNEYNNNPTAQNLELIGDAYKSVIYPLAEKNRKLNYSHNLVEHNAKENIYTLVQNAYFASQIDHEKK